MTGSETCCAKLTIGAFQGRFTLPVTPILQRIRTIPSVMTRSGDRSHSLSYSVTSALAESRPIAACSLNGWPPSHTAPRLKPPRERNSSLRDARERFDGAGVGGELADGFAIVEEP